jgi:hypothetical protein
MNVREAVANALDDEDPQPQGLADTLLAQALRLDENRPADDISVVVLKVAAEPADDVRRMTVRLPLGPARR